MPPRRRTPQLFLKVVVTPGDAADIRYRASCARLSVSAYLRTLGLNCKVKSVAEHEAVIRLCKINADLGRLGGLLKLWLSEQPGRGAPAGDVRDLLHKIEATQEEMRNAIRRI